MAWIEPNVAVTLDVIIVVIHFLLVLVVITTGSRGLPPVLPEMLLKVLDLKLIRVGGVLAISILPSVELILGGLGLFLTNLLTNGAHDAAHPTQVIDQ